MGVDDEGGSFDSEEGFSKHGFFFKNVVEIGHSFIGIGKEDEGELIFLDKFLMILDGVGAYSKDNGMIFLISLEVISELASLFGASWGIIFGVEIKDDVFSFKVVEGYGLILMILECKVRSGLSFLHMM